MAKKKDQGSVQNKNRPYVSNYPPLRTWLDKHHARCMWQVPMQCEHNEERRDEYGYPTGYVEGWLFPKQGGGATIAVLVIHAEQNGWEIYTPGESGRIDFSLADAEKRLGLEGT